MSELSITSVLLTSLTKILLYVVVCILYFYVSSYRRIKPHWWCYCQRAQHAHCKSRVWTLVIKTQYHVIDICGHLSTRRKPLTRRKSLTNFDHIMLYRVHLTMNGVRTHNFVMIGTDYTNRLVDLVEKHR
jgi:hypothetical protein